MFPLASLALPAVTSLFAATIPIIFASLGSLLGFALSRAAQLPRYIRLLVLLYQDSEPNSQTRKYVTSALLVLGGILSFMAHSFVPFTGAPVLGAVTAPIALLFALIVVLVTLDIVTNLNEPYLANLKSVYSNDFQQVQDDILTGKAQLGPKWAELTQKTKKILDELSPKVQEQGENLSKEINKYFSKEITELVLYLNSEDSSKIHLSQSEVKAITESLEPWKKVGGSFLLGAGIGGGTGMAASSFAAATLTPATWWTPFVPGAIQGIVFGGKAVVAPAVFGACTVAAPIALGLTIGTGVFSATMFTLGKIEESKLSEFLADIIISSLPMLRADGQLSEEEKLAVSQLLNNPKIGQKDRSRVETAMEANDSFDDIVSKNLLHEEKKDKLEIKRRLLLAITWEIAKADGIINDKERELHDRMAKILQVPQEVVDEIRRIITPSLFVKPNKQNVPVVVSVVG
jgi:uncharacterized tellurite resistance protein B-like protein